ncbi:MAG: TIGR01777 family oxidoreductase [Deltaproteobacteria bacterium]|nr:TIGR01777 family oxidoreductase [Deltaproteobacteria bacterium]
MRVIIAGGSGLIGRALTAKLAQEGHEIFILSRNPEKVQGLPSGASAFGWDGRTSHGWGPLVDGDTALVNLAGENVGAGRWTALRKQRIEESRLDAGRAVCEAVAKAKELPKVLLQSSAVGFYGSRGDLPLEESACPGDDFLARTCLAWEASTEPVAKAGVRRVILRTGVVLSRTGGAFPKLLMPFRFFAGGRLGDGKQWLPWIHLQDEVRAIRFLLLRETAEGPYNLAAPAPVTNAELTTWLAKLTGRPAWLPAPRFGMRLALGEMAEMVLGSQRASAARLLQEGFEFRFPEIESALRDLLGS